MIRSLDYSEIPLIIELASTLPREKRSQINDDVISQFLSPYSDNRKIFGYFDNHQNLISAIGSRNLLITPSWALQWVISKNATPIIFRKLVHLAIDEFIKQGCLDFFVPVPSNIQPQYQKIINEFSRDYWIYTESTVDKHSRSNYSLYWNIMGYRSYPFDLNINRCIKKR